MRVLRKAPCLLAGSTASARGGLIREQGPRLSSAASSRRGESNPKFPGFADLALPGNETHDRWAWVSWQGPRPREPIPREAGGLRLDRYKDPSNVTTGVDVVLPDVGVQRC